MDSARSQHLGNFSYFYETVSDDTNLNSSGEINLSLQRISSQENATLKISYEGGVVTDTVYINNHSVGNLDGTSPDIISFTPDYLGVDTVVKYTISAAQTNITQTNLTYYRYTGCNYDEATCIAEEGSSKLMGIVFFPLPFFLLLIAFMVIFSAVRIYLG